MPEARKQGRTMQDALLKWVIFVATDKMFVPGDKHPLQVRFGLRHTSTDGLMKIKFHFID